MRSYQAARTLFSILQIISWGFILLGIIVAVIGMGAAGAGSRSFGGSATTLAFFSALIPGLALTFMGFLGLVFAQWSRASVDSAEYGQQSLQIAREQLEISKQGLRGSDRDPGYHGLQQAKDELHSGGQTAPSTSASSAYARRALEKRTDASERPASAKTLVYKSRAISFDGRTYYVAKKSFATVEDAQTYIDELGGSTVRTGGNAGRS